MVEPVNKPEAVASQAPVRPERVADSPNAEPHPVEDLGQAPVPPIEELLRKQPAGETPGVSGLPTPGVRATDEVTPTPGVGVTAGPVEDLLQVDEAKTFGFADAAQLAEKLEQLRKQHS